MCIVIFECPGMIISLFLIMNDHVLQLANEHTGIWVGTDPGDVVANQCQGNCVKPISR